MWWTAMNPNVADTIAGALLLAVVLGWAALAGIPRHLAELIEPRRSADPQTKASTRNSGPALVGE